MLIEARTPEPGATRQIIKSIYARKDSNRRPPAWKSDRSNFFCWLFVDSSSRFNVHLPANANLFAALPDIKARRGSTARRSFARRHLLNFRSGEHDEPPYQFEGVASITTTYDEQDRPIETLYHNADHWMLCRVTSTWSAAGLLDRETLFIGHESPFADEESEEPPLEIPIQKNVISYTYDEAGRCMERKYEMDGHERFRCRFAFDDRGNPIEMRVESPSLDPSNAIEQHIPLVRYTYSYDAQGNWTERVTSNQSTAAGDVHAAKIDRRVIEYFSG